MDVTMVILECKRKAKEQGLSLAAVGQAVGVSKSQVGQWYSGRKTPSAPNLLKLITTVGLSFQLTEPTAKELPVTSQRLQQGNQQPAKAEKSSSRSTKENKSTPLQSTKAPASIPATPEMPDWIRGHEKEIATMAKRSFGH